MVRQFDLDFEGGLTQRYPEFLDCVRESVYGCGRQFKAIAADLDMSPSLLHQKLSDQGDTHFALVRLPELIAATQRLDPVFWLVEKFCDDTDARHRRAVADLARVVGDAQRILKSIEP